MRRVLVSGLGAAAIVLALLAVSAAVTGGHRVAIGPLAFSATHPSNLFGEAAVAALAALLLQPPSPRQQTLGAACLVLLLAALASGSSPRRVGDGDEYLAMASNLAHGRRPSLSATEFSDSNRRMVAWHWSEARPAIPSLVAADGRQDYWHFWLYPLVIAPFVGISGVLGINPNHGVTCAHLLMLGAVVLPRVEEARVIHRGAAAVGAAGLVCRQDPRRGVLRLPAAGGAASHRHAAMAVDRPGGTGRGADARARGRLHPRLPGRAPDARD